MPVHPRRSALNLRPSRPALLLAAFLYVLVQTVMCGCGAEQKEGKVKVAASIAPLADFCSEVGGDLVEVELLVPPGASPHTYEPTARQMRFVGDAEMLVLNGLELESWATDVMKRAGNSSALTVITSEAVPVRQLIKAGGGECGDEHAAYNPHVWLDPGLAALQVNAIAEGLADVDPDNGEIYLENARDYSQGLGELDGRIMEETAAFSKKKFISFHPSFSYFARRYGLEEVGSIEKLPGKEPSAREFSSLIEKARDQGVAVVFSEPQFDPRTAEALAAEAGAAVIVKTVEPAGPSVSPCRPLRPWGA